MLYIGTIFHSTFLHCAALGTNFKGIPPFMFWTKAIVGSVTRFRRLFSEGTIVYFLRIVANANLDSRMPRRIPVNTRLVLT